MTLEELELLSVSELKAIAYDEIVHLENSQKNLHVLNQLIAKKLIPQTQENLIE